MHAIRSVEELEEKLSAASALPSAKQQIDFLCDHYLIVDLLSWPADPWAAAYRERVIELWCRLSGRTAYVADETEQSGYGNDIDVGSPSPFSIGSSRLVGEMLIAWGFILKTLDLDPGKSLLEYGPGSGQILLNAARLGIRAAAVDIAPQQIRVIREQARLLGNLDVRARLGRFGDTVEPGERYDAVVFFEAFHHALDHIALVDRLHDVVSDDGVLLLAGEPILSRASPFRPVVPFPWGPRLDLLSLRAMRTHGWMELGFQEEYLVRLLHRAGWVVRKHVCPLTDLGTSFVATKNTGRVTAGGLYLPEDEADTWHQPEATQRWTRGCGVVSLDGRPRWTQVAVSVTSHNPRQVPVTLSCGGHQTTARIDPGRTVALTLPLPSGARRLEVRSPTFVPRDLGLNEDARSLGVCVGELVYG